jgi:hypothetical protein
MNSSTPPRQLIFDPPSEVFATDNGGCFTFLLQADSESSLTTAPYDEIRFVISMWYPAPEKAIDLDRAYLELRASLDPDEEHWTKLAEVEPVVPAYNAGDRFDGWIVLPVLAERTAFSLAGRGFQPRSRIQIRTSAYLVS